MLFLYMIMGGAVGIFIGVSGLLILGTNTSLLGLFIIFLSTAGGMAIGVSVLWCQELQELLRLRAMKRFFWNWLPCEAFQKLVDEALRCHALNVKWCANELVSLHRRGVGDGAVQGTEEKEFEGKKENLEFRFKNYQGEFYTEYDKISSFIDLFGKGKLKERSWKVYATDQSQAK